jgi:uncharacterized protein (TIGR03435 family)
MTQGTLSGPAGYLRILLLFITSMLLPAAALSQLTHKGPANEIALAKTLAPFDVVSVKQNNSGDGSWGINIHDNTLTATNVPLEMLIEFAYDLKEDLISGLSGPVNSAHFDVVAKIVPPDDKPVKLADGQLQAMLIPVLVDRFHLNAHLQPKVLPVYDLVVAHGGPKLKLSAAERTDSSWNINGENTSKVLTSKSATMPDLAAALGDEVHRQVVDKTGLTGSADITLKWSDDVAADAGGSNVISIFTAVEEQLGLKLQSSKGPVDTLVIDHVEMPSVN